MAELYWIRTPEMSDMFSEGYIGMSTISARHRWNAHKAASKVPEKQHLPIYRAFHKHGAEGLVMQVLVSGPDDYITDLEAKLRPDVGIGWNCAQGGQATGKGRKASKESIEKRRKKMLGFKHSEETRKNMSLAAKGKPKSAEHVEKMRQTKIGLKVSEATREKHRQAMLGKKSMTEGGRAALSNFQKELPPWKRSRSCVKVWYYAADAFNSMVEGKISQRTLAKMFGVKDSTVSALHAKLSESWNPREDPDWVIWQSAILNAPVLDSGWNIGDPQPAPKKPDRTEYLKNKPKTPWSQVRANKSNWAQCSYIQELLELKIGHKKICDILGLNSVEKPLDTIFKKLKSGWIPSEDAAYMSWLEQYKGGFNAQT